MTNIAIHELENIAFSERGGVTCVTSYVFAGNSNDDGRAIYEKIITRFSIARGVIDDKKRTGTFYDVNGREFIPMFKGRAGNNIFMEV